MLARQSSRSGTVRRSRSRKAARKPGPQLPVARMPLQRSAMEVSQPGDPYEREADRVADQVMGMPAASFAPPAAPGVGPGGASAAPNVQRMGGGMLEEDDAMQRTPEISRMPGASEDEEMQAMPMGEEDELQAKGMDDEELQMMPMGEEDELQTMPMGEDDEMQRACAACDQDQAQRDAAPNAGGGSAVPASVAGDIRARKGGGAPLPESERSFFEPRFGRSFGNVRIHADADAARLARSVNAKAFTVGRDVFFGADQFRPGTQDGRRLMAHELTHTVQQGKSGGLQREVVQRDEEPDLEYCSDLLEQIRCFVFCRKPPDRMKGLLQRFEELKANPLGLGPQGIENHERAIREMQTGLRKRLEFWKDNNCYDSGLKLPHQAWDLAKSPADRESLIAPESYGPALEPTGSSSLSPDIVSQVWFWAIAAGLGVAMVIVILGALANPEPATKLVLAGLSAMLIVSLFTHIGMEDQIPDGMRQM